MRYPPRRCEWCEGQKKVGDVICPLRKGKGQICAPSWGSCLEADVPPVDACHPAEVMRMERDPTYRPLIDGPARRAKNDA